ncbi:hypothetical protein QJQ45_022468 [Haematococcus lacustris]|nr:hypothetical protein QJQ45_022468 [Haematococcus lacustris]
MATNPLISGNQATILDDDNWPIWSIRTEGLLVEAGLWSVVADGVTPLPTAPPANATQQEQAVYAAELARSRAEAAQDRKAKAFIQRHVSNLHIFTVKSADTAEDAWQTLAAQFTQSSVARQSQLQQQLSLLRMEPGESVARFYARLQHLLTQLEACNCETSESTVVLAILAALPPEYEGVVERMRYDQTSGDLTVERIKRVLLQKEADILSKQMQQQLSTSSSTLWSYSSPSDTRGAGSSGGQGGRGGGRSFQPSREQQSRAQSPDRSTREASSHAHLTCNYCAKPGHIMSECFIFDRDQRSRMKTLFSNPARPSSPGRRSSPGRSSSPARPSSPSRGRTQTPGRAAAQSPSRGASLFTATAADDDDDDDDALMQMVQPRLNFNSDLYSPFFIDSGASQHILNDLQFFYSYTPFAPDKHRPVKLAAAGHRVWAVGAGSVFLSTKRGSWFLSHALYVPDSKENFISVSAATDDGSSFLFRGDLCQISSNRFGSMLRVNAHKIRNSYILAAVPMPDGPDTDSEPEKLYHIQDSPPQPDNRVRLEPLTNAAAPSAYSSTSNSPQVWHQRLCHASYTALSRLQSEGMVSGVPVTAAQFRAAASDPAVCVGCVKGKQHKNVAFAGPPPNAAPVTAPLGLIHMDVCGPMHAKARDGSLYVATFLDEHTKLSVCVPISSKSQVPDVVRTVIEQLETQSGFRCKAIRTDNGTEYVNNRMTEYCSSKGIVHQHSAPYSPQQNGAAERLNRTIFEKARSILHAADISLSFWAHAVKYANYIRCLLPVSGQPLTPWEAFYGVKPDLSGLRVFGCRVWLHVPDQKRSKLQPKSIEGLFIGYQPGSKAYLVQVNGRETSSKDIVFDELSVLQPAQSAQPAQPVFLLPLPPNPMSPSEPAAPAEGGNDLQQTSSSGSDDSGSSSSSSSSSSSDSSRPGSSAQQPQSRPLDRIEAQQDSSRPDSPLTRDTVGAQPVIPAAAPAAASAAAPAASPAARPAASAAAPAAAPAARPAASAAAPAAAPAAAARPAATARPGLAQPALRVPLIPASSAARQAAPAVHPSAPMPVAPDPRSASPEASAAPLPRRNPPRIRQLPQKLRESNLYAMAVSDSPINDTPTVAEALASPQADMWIEAMNAELASLHSNQTWSLEERPANARVLPTKWVLKVKRDAAGNVERYKARLVAKGYFQQSGVDVGDVYAPVSKHTTLRALLAKAASENMEVHQLDFETAFLNGVLEEHEVIYVQQPEGFREGSSGTVCRLHKALYGLRQAPRAWHARLCEELLAMNFKSSEADPALFTLHLPSGTVYLLVYVDDCLLCTQQGDTIGLAHVKQKLSSVFKLKDLGEARCFLGMQLVRDRAEGTILIIQQKLIHELVTTHSMSNAHSKTLPMASAVKLVREGEALDTSVHHYSALVGSLLYLSCCTRPDIAFSVGALARHMSAPTKQHWAAACTVLCYLKGTSEQGLLFGGVTGLQGFTDADYAGDKDTARSTTGYLFTLIGGAISWSSRLQPTVAMSTAEAEYMAASSATKEALWLRKLMRDLQLEARCVQMSCDNQAALQLLHNPMATARAKHIDVHHHFVRERRRRRKKKKTTPAMALAVDRFVAASDLPQERGPNSSRLYPSKAICVMPRGEGGLKLFRAVPPASLAFFSVLAEPLWYNAQVRMNPAAREAAAEQGRTHVRHRTPMLQPSHWVGPNGCLYPLDPTGQGPLGAFWAEEGAAWEPAAVARLNKPSYRVTPEERATHLRPLPAQRHVAQEQAQGQELGGAWGEEWLSGPWAHLQLDPQVWGMGTTTLLDFSVKHARVRLHQLKRVSADPLYPPSGGLWPALWGVRPPRAAGEPEVAAVADGALRELELKWEASAQQVADQGAAGEREQQGRDMRAAQQAERQLEAQQRRGGRQPVAQPGPRADTVDQLAVGVQAGQPCAKVWKELLDPTLRREHVIVAWRVLHACLMVGALWGHILKGTAAPGSSACRFCQPGHLETLTHAFLTCPAVVPAWEWVLDVYGRLTGTRPPSGDAMLLLSGRPTRGEDPPFQPPDSLLWLRLRVAYLDTSVHHYSALVGSLLYLSCCTRPDIAFSVGALARHMSAPTKQHWAAACTVLCYLKGTSEQGLLFGGVTGLQGFTDADYAGDKDTARSTTGYLFTLIGGAISWSSRLQPTVAMSTAEAEYMAASSATKEALWLRKLMRDLQLEARCVQMSCDNQAALQLLHNPMATARAKHIDVHHHFVRERRRRRKKKKTTPLSQSVRPKSTRIVTRATAWRCLTASPVRERITRGEVAFSYCHTDSMLADIFTKPLAAVKFNAGKQGCGVFSS